MNQGHKKMLSRLMVALLFFTTLSLSGKIEAATNPTYYEQFNSTHTAEVIAGELNQLPTEEISEANLNSTNLFLQNKKLEDISGIEIFSKLSTLHLSGNQLSELPPEITSLVTLHSLDVGQNKLQLLPDDIGNLNELQYLSLYGNELTELPESISQMSELINLGLNQNSLTSLPSGIGNLKKLQYLYGNENEISALPEGISELTALRIIDFSYNKLVELPVNIGNLNNTTTFDFSHNLLLSIPESVGYLTTTDNVRFGNNQLIEVPETMKIFMDKGGYFFVESQECKTELDSGFITKNYEFNTLPIFNNIKSFHEGIKVSYQLIKPDLSQVDITADIENQLLSNPEKLSINKSNFNQLGSYKLIANVSNPTLWILFNWSTYQLSFDINGAIPIDLELNGDAEQSLFVGEEYIEQGATASDLNGPVAVTIIGEVDTSEAGLYVLTYTATNQYESVEIERQVEVKEKDPINLRLNGSESITLYVGDTYEELGAVADDLNGDVEVLITGEVDTTKVGEYFITYEASNTYESKEISRSVYVVSKSEAGQQSPSDKNNQMVESKPSISTGQIRNPNMFLWISVSVLMIGIGLKIRRKNLK